jgi:hypothetical protein
VVCADVRIVSRVAARDDGGRTEIEVAIVRARVTLASTALRELEAAGTVGVLPQPA